MKNLPITNKKLWSNLTPSMYYYDKKISPTMSLTETFARTMDWTNMSNPKILTRHHVTKTMVDEEGIEIIWNGNPFKL